MLRRLALPLLALTLALPDASAQVSPEPEPTSLYTTERLAAPGISGVASFGLTVQRYAITTAGTDQAVSQLSTPLRVYVASDRGFAASLQAAYAGSSVGDLEAINGLSDVQLGLSYTHQLGPAEVVASLGTSLPTSGAGLTPEQQAASLLLVRNEFALAVPAVRQGFRLAPGVTVAVPVDPALAVGFGVAYQVRSGFTPFEGLDRQYEPGNEIMLTAGLSARPVRGVDWTADVAWAFYGRDTFGDATLEPGSRFSATTGLSVGIGQQAFLLGATYRHRGAGTLGADLIEAPVADELGVRLGGHFRFEEVAELGLGFGARYLGDFGVLGEAASGPPEGALALADHQLLFDVSLAPSFRLTPDVRLVSVFSYTVGLGRFIDVADVTPIDGFRLGAGVEVGF